MPICQKYLGVKHLLNAKQPWGRGTKEITSKDFKICHNDS